MTTETSARSLLPGMLFLLLVIAGCAKGVPSVASDLEAEIPASLRADYLSFADNCSKCHGLDRPLTAHVTDTRHWDLYVARMMRTAGCAISESERPKILRFLYWYTERKQRLASEESDAAKQSLPPVPEQTSGAQAPAAAPAGATEAPAVEPKIDSNVTPAEGKPGETAP